VLFFEFPVQAVTEEISFILIVTAYLFPSGERLGYLRLHDVYILYLSYGFECHGAWVELPSLQYERRKVHACLFV
jgi:hypothetical protein